MADQECGGTPTRLRLLHGSPGRDEAAALQCGPALQRDQESDRLAVEHGSYERAELLVDRALRAAAREQLRTTVGSAGPWLRSFIARASGLSSRHSGFLASIPEPATPTLQNGRDDAAAYGAFIVPLTTRETDVLKLLADFCSNEEIAADLVLSLNTVKTHMRSLFQKLAVTRRADAVRRGRALGLC